MPHGCIAELWEAFNDVAEGFGLTQVEFTDILRAAAKAQLGLTEPSLETLATLAFETFDDDHNGLVDALESLATLALMSGMSPEDKVRFAFSIYDFDETGELSVDEVVLLMRSAVSGVCKLAGVDPPMESELETIAVAAFDEDAREEPRLKPEEFFRFCLRTPEIMSWLEYCSQVCLDFSLFSISIQYRIYLNLRSSQCLQVPELDAQHADFQDAKALRIASRESSLPFRGNLHTAALDRDGGVTLAREILAKGPAEEAQPQRPWQQAIAFLEPTSNVPHPKGPPAGMLDLAWAYGFNTMTSRGSVHYSGGGGSIYPCGTLGVLQFEGGGPRASATGDELKAGPPQRNQRYFGSHTDGISVMACHVTPDKRRTLVASGQLGAIPCVRNPP